MKMIIELIRSRMLFVVAIFSASASAQTSVSTSAWPDCTKEYSIPSHKDGAPVDDFDGFRPGALLDESLAYLACKEMKREPKLRPTAAFGSLENTIEIPIHWTDFDIHGYGSARVRTLTGLVLGMGRGGQQSVRNDPWKDLFSQLSGSMSSVYLSYSLASFGRPGEEKVYAFTRREGFPDGVGISVNDIVANAIGKYGQPQSRRDSTGGIDMMWSFDRAGVPSTAKNCGGVVYWSQHFTSIREYESQSRHDCAVTVMLKVSRSPKAGVYAHSFELGIRNSAAFADDLQSNTLGIAISALPREYKDAPKF